MYLYNSASKKKELFTPLEQGKVRIYSCGPTVYDYAHLGHARNAIVFDLLHRVFLTNGYKVQFVKNYTDIDDKIINKAKSEQKTIEEVSEFFITADEQDIKDLSLLTSFMRPKATQYIREMTELVQKLLNENIAYKTSDGIYFDISKDTLYGSISHRVQEDTMQRIKANEEKRNEQDFALWKFELDASISYEAPFGRGRPGWHTECCAMIKSIFGQAVNGYFIDIHCGGSDLLFPHHENEATQIRCSEQSEISKYWLHNGFVQIDNEKMSKSLGNSFFLKDVLDKFHPEVVRYYLLSSHYRINFDFSHSGLLEAKKFIDKLYRLKQQVYQVEAESEYNNELVLQALSDDLNISVALSHIFEYIKTSFEILANQATTKNERKNKNKEIKGFFVFLQAMLGIGQCDAYEYFRFGLSPAQIELIQEKVDNRNTLRVQKQFELADEIKQELITQGILLMDTANGTLWEQNNTEEKI